MSPYSVSAAGFHASAGWMLRFMGVSTLGAVTPTNRYGSAGRSPAAKPRPLWAAPRRAAKAALPTFAAEPEPATAPKGRSAGDREGGAQARDLEDLAGRRLEPPKFDAASALAGALQRPHEHAEAGRVDEVHPGEIDDDLAGTLLDQPVELVPQRRRGGHVDLALDDDRWRAAVVTDRDPEVIARGRVRAGGDHDGQTTQPLSPVNQLEPHGGAPGVRVVAPSIGERVDDLEPAAVDAIGVERPELGLAAPDVAHLDAGAVVVEPDGNTRLSARVPVGVRDELAGQEEDQLDEVVGAPPSPQRGGDESARAGRAGRHRGKDGRELVRRLLAPANAAPGAARVRRHA